MAEKYYISLEAAKKAMCGMCEGGAKLVCGTLNDCCTTMSIFNSIPAADVRPVVLCKDCVYSDKWYKDRLICYLWNEHDGNSVFEDGFCNYGEKREES
jgi:hypothetical protein